MFPFGWLSTYVKVAQLVLDILKIVESFLDIPCILSKGDTLISEGQDGDVRCGSK